jgi:hypothetical protein
MRRGKAFAGKALAGKALDWETDGADWPNRSTSRFVKAADLVWHVQTMGPGAGAAAGARHRRFHP